MSVQARCQARAISLRYGIIGQSDFAFHQLADINQSHSVNVSTWVQCFGPIPINRCNPHHFTRSCHVMVAGVLCFLAFILIESLAENEGNDAEHGCSICVDLNVL